MLFRSGFDLVSGNTDLIPGCFECLASIVVIGVDGIAVSHQRTMQVIDGGLPFCTAG